MKRIVIATDGSGAAEEAVEMGLELAKEQGARVWLVHVQPPLLAVGSYAAMPVLIEPEQRPTVEEDEVLQRAAALAAERGIEAELVERVGQTADEIVAVADEVEADLIVVGSRGLGAVGRLILGTVSYGVLRQSRRPVLVVRAAKAPVQS